MDNNSFKDNQKDDEHGSEIEIREILKPYLRKYYWFVISALLCLVISYLYLKTKTTVYEVSASVLIKDTKSTPGSQDFAALRDISGFGKIGSNGVENEMELLKSKKMMQKVVQYLNLETTVYQKG